MTADALLDKIGFTEDMKFKYYTYSNYLKSKCDYNYPNDYIKEKISFADCINKLSAFADCKLSEYTINLIFVVDVAALSYEKYKALNISDDIYFDTMKDILYKLQEALNYKGVFGIIPVSWYEGFFTLKRFALGKLQYDALNSDEEIKLSNYTIKKGQFITSCHIPSSGPLFHELCIESYKKAHKFFENQLTDGILPIMCSSWLLYPPYRIAFKEGSNMMQFVSDFEMINSFELDEFSAAWRIFNMDFKDNADVLPQNTSLQRNFVKYIKEGGSFGGGRGIILFDGDRIINENILYKKD